MVAGLKEIATRNIGNFLLPGKSKPVGIHELLIVKDGILEKEKKALYELFAGGLVCFGENRWDDAIVLFQECRNLKNDDGPTLFYLTLCRKYQKNPPEPGWKGIVHIDKK